MPFYKVLVGLGNPGARYLGTRHNVGFEIVESLVNESAKRSGSELALTSAWQEKGDAARAEISLAGEKILVLKPLTFMNLSGDPVSEVMNFYKIEPQALVVVCDDIDLPISTLRLKQGGGEGGHNGLRSISERTGSREYMRLRVGVGRPQSTSQTDSQNQSEEEREKSVTSWVLEKFDSQDQNIIAEAKSRAVEALIMLGLKGLKLTQNRYNN